MKYKVKLIIVLIDICCKIWLMIYSYFLYYKIGFIILLFFIGIFCVRKQIDGQLEEKEIYFNIVIFVNLILRFVF